MYSGHPAHKSRARPFKPIFTIADTITGMLSLDRQNKWREQYRLEHPGWHPATEVYAERVRDHLRPGDRLLDIGCGRGGLIEQLQHPISRTFGIDPDFASLRDHRLTSFPRAVAPGHHLPFRNGSFDVITAAWVLEHLVEPEAAFAAIARALRPGGAFIFITPNARHPLAWANNIAGKLGRVQGRLVDLLYGRAEDDTFPTAYKANTPKATAHLAARAGLAVASLDLITDPSYLAFNALAFRVMSGVDNYLPPDRQIHIVGVIRKDV